MEYTLFLCPCVCECDKRTSKNRVQNVPGSFVAAGFFFVCGLSSPSWHIWRKKENLYVCGGVKLNHNHRSLCEKGIELFFFSSERIKKQLEHMEWNVIKLQLQEIESKKKTHTLQKLTEQMFTPATCFACSLHYSNFTNKRNQFHSLLARFSSIFCKCENLHNQFPGILTKLRKRMRKLNWIHTMYVLISKTFPSNRCRCRCVSS